MNTLTWILNIASTFPRDHLKKQFRSFSLTASEAKSWKKKAAENFFSRLKKSFIFSLKKIVTKETHDDEHLLCNGVALSFGVGWTKFHSVENPGAGRAENPENLSEAHWRVGQILSPGPALISANFLVTFHKYPSQCPHFSIRNVHGWYLTWLVLRRALKLIPYLRICLARYLT